MPVAPLVLEYDSFSTSGFTERTDWSKALTNTDEDNCPVLKCEVKKREGENCVAYPADGKVKMRSAAPWTITYQNNEVEGYSEDLCIECSNESKTVTTAHRVI